MGFDQSVITSVLKPVVLRGEVYLRWTSSAPATSSWQVYINGSLAWSGDKTWCWVPVPQGPVRIDIGAVNGNQESIDFSQPSLYGEFGYGMTPYGWVPGASTAPERRAKLSWQGGYALATDLQEFRVYGESSPGGGINYTTPLARIAAYPGGLNTLGYGRGPYGAGTYGLGSGTYTWTSDPLSSGTWNFAVRPADLAGNEGTAQVTSVTISAPPRSPAYGTDGVSRLSYSLAGFGSGGFGGGNTYGNGTYGSGSYGGGYPYGEGAVTLTWLPSPS